LPGRWQDWCSPEKVGELLGLSEGGQGYDFVFIDTFAEDYEGAFCSEYPRQMVMDRGGLSSDIERSFLSLIMHRIEGFLRDSNGSVGRPR